MWCGNEKYQELNEQKGSWEVFKLALWLFFTHDCLQLASSISFFKVLRDYASFGTKVSAGFKIGFTILAMMYFLGFEVPKRYCCKRISDTGDKLKNLGKDKKGDGATTTTEGGDIEKGETKKKEKKQKNDEDEGCSCC
ncbi:hypothetical protein DFA_09708 [Cavenderia fasciculata]|uniref:Uncharacterized protein n=1 Tax=Cavenderia fasciculata TaxID=261658 RepID=F4Q8D6_CACFS|nr:uncharacterized protein DFA_09708 [Cavenderia fasciculata]EGG16036.1 hypothetical protein DFA_09708 [Cavenderia fasciculata]|eukprot:XP_004352361.1 hypothetical protein DFA_09708 [Cavenderia fasciculata]